MSSIPTIASYREHCLFSWMVTEELPLTVTPCAYLVPPIDTLERCQTQLLSPSTTSGSVWSPVSE